MKEAGIQSVVGDGLCTGCGLCGGICPAKAIRMDTTSLPRPVLDAGRCSDCGLCLKVCPGPGVQFADLEESGAGKHPGQVPEVGPLLEARSGWACNQDVRAAGASGGLATALATWMLETGRVDAVVSVSGDPQEPFAVNAHLAQNVAQLRGAQQSKYNMAPYDGVLRHMRTREGRYLVVGLPCQIAGLRNAMRLVPVLQERIVAMVGLLCGYAMDPKAAEQMCRICRVKPETVDSFLGWRALEYPGSFAFRTRDGKTHRIQLPDWLDAGTARFSQLRCHLCPDGFARAADLSLGDRSSVTPDLNETLTLVRTALGRKLLDEASDAGAIQTRTLATDEALRESTCAFMKQIKVRMPLALARSLASRNRALPHYDLQAVQCSRRDRLAARSYWSLCRLARSRWVAPWLNLHPSLNQALGRMIYRRYHRPHWRVLAWLGIL
jgi:coenzyme F420 hydrogenase subunit beta